MEAATLTPLARGPRLLTTDEQLVAATRLGDDRAFETLYDRYHRRITAYVVGMVKDHQRAEDVTQEIFLNALRRIRATDRDIVFKAWIYEIAKNACIDQYRRSRRTDEVLYDADGQDGGVVALVSGGPGPDEAVESRKQLHDLCGAFGGLSDSHHQILVLRELEGRSYQEIGERMQMTRPAVESTLFRARKRLSEEYAELVSGERCRKVQAIIAASEEASLGVRDRRTMARHVSHCQPCRRAAALAGLERVPARTGARARIAALLPLPAFLRERWGGGPPNAASAADGSGATGAGLAGWLHATAPLADSASGWVKTVAATAAVAVAGVGAGAVATHHGGSAPTRSPGVSTTVLAPVAPAGPRTTTATTAPRRSASRIGGRATHRAAGHATSKAPTRTAVAATGGLGQRAAAAPSDPPAVEHQPNSSSAPSSPAATTVDQTTPTPSPVGAATPAPVTSATQALPAPEPTAPAVPSIPPVGDTAATVPSLGDVTQQAGTAVDQTADAAQPTVSRVKDGVQGAVSGLGNLSSGG